MTFRMRQTFAISSFNSWYFSNFSSSLSFTLSSPGMATSIVTTSLSFLSRKTMYGLLASIFWSHWTVKSHSILKLSLFTTPSGFCSYQLLALSNSYLPPSCQWIYRATLSCLPLYCLRQLTALTRHMGYRFSLTPAHSTQRGFCCVINVKFRIICSQSLFLGAAYQSLSTSFQISFSNPLSQSVPSFSLTYCSCILINCHCCCCYYYYYYYHYYYYYYYYYYYCCCCCYYCFHIDPLDKQTYY